MKGDARERGGKGGRRRGGEGRKVRSPSPSISAYAPVISVINDMIYMDLAVFTALHVMQTRYSEENSVRLSVRLSVRPSVCLSHACIVTKRKKDLSRFLCHTKEYLS